MGFVDKIRAKLELHRLEQRYSRRDKRITLYANAEYVNGEYVFKPTGASMYARTDSISKSGPTSRTAEIFPSARASRAF